MKRKPFLVILPRFFGIYLFTIGLALSLISCPAGAREQAHYVPAGYVPIHDVLTGISYAVPSKWHDYYKGQAVRPCKKKAVRNTRLYTNNKDGAIWIDIITNKDKSDIDCVNLDTLSGGCNGDRKWGNGKSFSDGHRIKVAQRKSYFLPQACEWLHAKGESSHYIDRRRVTVDGTRFIQTSGYVSGKTKKNQIPLFVSNLEGVKNGKLITIGFLTHIPAKADNVAAFANLIDSMDLDYHRPEVQKRSESSYNATEKQLQKHLQDHSDLVSDYVRLWGQWQSQVMAHGMQKDKLTGMTLPLESTQKLESTKRLNKTEPLLASQCFLLKGFVKEYDNIGLDLREMTYRAIARGLEVLKKYPASVGYGRSGGISKEIASYRKKARQLSARMHPDNRRLFLPLHVDHWGVWSGWMALSDSKVELSKVEFDLGKDCKIRYLADSFGSYLFRDYKLRMVEKEDNTYTFLEGPLLKRNWKQRTRQKKPAGRFLLELDEDGEGRYVYFDAQGERVIDKGKIKRVQKFDWYYPEIPKEIYPRTVSRDVRLPKEKAEKAVLAMVPPEVLGGKDQGPPDAPGNKADKRKIKASNAQGEDISASIKSGTVSSTGVTIYNTYNDIFNTKKWGRDDGYIWRVNNKRPLKFAWRQKELPRKSILRVKHNALCGPCRGAGRKLSSALIKVNGKKLPLLTPDNTKIEFDKVDISKYVKSGKNTVEISSAPASKLMHGVQTVEIKNRD